SPRVFFQEKSRPQVPLQLPAFFRYSDFQAGKNGKWFHFAAEIPEYSRWNMNLIAFSQPSPLQLSDTPGQFSVRSDRKFSVSEMELLLYSFCLRNPHACLGASKPVPPCCKKHAFFHYWQ